MAHVTMPDGREFDIEDGQPELEAYYLGEGASVEKSAESSASFPQVFNGGDGYEGGSSLPEAEHHEGELHLHGEGELAAGPAGEPLVGVEHPADGTWSPPVSNDASDQH
jgi:glutaredoxin